MKDSDFHHDAIVHQHPVAGDDELTVGRFLQWGAVMVGAGYSAIAVRNFTLAGDAVDRAWWQFLWVFTLLIVIIVYLLGGVIHERVIKARCTLSTQPSRRMRRWLEKDRS
jgi:hypothetical protein